MKSVGFMSLHLERDWNERNINQVINYWDMNRIVDNGDFSVKTCHVFVYNKSRHKKMFARHTYTL